MNLTASKLRTIQMLGVGDISTYLEQRLIDEALKGEDSVTVPESVFSGTDRETLIEAGFTITYESTIGEYEISWRLNDGN